MRCSFSELKSLIFNSGIGSNFEIGICEDISEAVAYLEKYNLKACEEVLKCFKCKKFGVKNTKVFKNTIRFDNSRVMFEGISGIDYFQANFYDEIFFNNLDSPMILAGLGLFNEVENFQIIYSSEIIGYVEKNNFFWDESFNKNNVDITVKKKKFIPPKFSRKGNYIEIENKIWGYLEVLEYKTLVPQSKKSRDDGAGAQIDDND